MKEVNPDEKAKRGGRPKLPESDKRVACKIKISPSEITKLLIENQKVKPQTPFSTFLREKLLGENSVAFSLKALDDQTRQLLTDSSRLANLFSLMAKRPDVSESQKINFQRDSEEIRLSIQLLYQSITELTKSGFLYIKIGEVLKGFNTIVSDYQDCKHPSTQMILLAIKEQNIVLEKLYQEIIKKQK